MKNFLTILLIASMIISCGKKAETDQQEAGEAVEIQGNEALTAEVDKIHDEAMKKMEGLFSEKGRLKEKIANTPGISAEQKSKIESAIVKLDSADEAMRVWMHEYSPLPDSGGVEKAREYLENEMVKIKRVQVEMEEALTEAKAN